MADPEEKIVMTPTKKGRTTCIKIEKVRKIDEGKVQHQGGGQNTGLVINKQTSADGEETPPQLQLEFKCFLVDNKTGKHVPESRVLKFWFAPNTDYLDKVTGAYEFFRELVRPDNFPRDYVGFIKRVMKQVQTPRYTQIKKVDVDLTTLEESEAPPPNPDTNFRDASVEHVEQQILQMQQFRSLLSVPRGAGGDGGRIVRYHVGLPRSEGLNYDQDGMSAVDERPPETIVQEQVLLTLESAYPNILPVEDLASLTNADESMIVEQLRMLQGRDLIREVEPGRFVRRVKDENTEVKVVKNMPMQTGNNKPTVAIITSKYYEKLAVDSMMANKTTFVRYKTEGESNVYTIGQIGSHKVVSTKLPVIGRQRAAQISSGNTTTRLLGTFGDIEHVLLVGVGGGVPHYTDFFKHARLGDVVISTPNDRGYTYIYCDQVRHDEEGKPTYTRKFWSPQDRIMEEIVKGIEGEYKANPSVCPWEVAIGEGHGLLHGQEVNFDRPHPATDRLYMNIGGNDVIEVGHPPVPENIGPDYVPGRPMLRFGSVGSGKPVVRDDQLRMDFAARHDVIAYDTEFDQVLDSIVGNRKDSFVFIRGIADYLDGMKNVEWQPYAALAAAAVMKLIIERLPVPE